MAAPAAVSALAVVLAVVGLTWLGWTAWFHGSPEVRSELVTFEVTATTRSRRRSTSSWQDGVEASCRVRALAEDQTAVGELAFTPVDGANEVVIRTERRATAWRRSGAPRRTSRARAEPSRPALLPQAC